MEERAQTSIDYLLILAGSMLVVIFLVLIFNNQIFNPAESHIENQTTIIRNLTNFT